MDSFTTVFVNSKDIMSNYTLTRICPQYAGAFSNTKFIVLKLSSLSQLKLRQLSAIVQIFEIIEGQG